MKSKILIMIFAVFILAGFGCQRGAPGFEPELVEYHKGYGGLEINIVKGLPPDEVIEKGEFVVGLELKNKGAYDIEGGKIIVYGFEDGYVSLDKFQVNVDIDGKKPGFPEGGFEIVNFNGINHAIPGSADIFLSPFTVRAYYRYQTEAGAEVCINPNIYSYVKTKEIVCEPGAVELSGGQGAPVAIT
ncbi:hypothetical protein GOV06_03615, partial [Candidatus Woesearchaeota archaeon]|nr:hypothetical protein [Candidatus Woesearchaeota archaeon]